jgi:hypothetical protein
MFAGPRRSLPGNESIDHGPFPWSDILCSPEPTRPHPGVSDNNPGANRRPLRLPVEKLPDRPAIPSPCGQLGAIAQNQDIVARKPGLYLADAVDVHDG